SPGFIVRFSLPMRKSMVPLIIQTNCSCGCLWAAACAPALIVQYTTVPCLPDTTRRRILSVICSSGTEASLSKPAMTGMSCSSAPGIWRLLIDPTARSDLFEVDLLHHGSPFGDVRFDTFPEFFRTARPRLVAECMQPLDRRRLLESAPHFAVEPTDD